jgi:hypothetical protein
MQITLGRNDEDMVGANVEPLRDQFDGHRRVSRQDFMQLGRHRTQMVHDDNRRAQIGRHVLKQAFVGLQPTG